MELAAYLITTLLGIISIILLYMKWSFSYWKRRNIPYLEASIPFGNMGNPITTKKSQAQIFQDKYTEFRKMGAKCGGLHAYTAPILLILDPEYIKHILIKDFQNFQARGFYNNEKHQPVSANLFTSDGAKWKILRNKFTPTFTTAKMKTMYNLMTKAAELMEKYVEDYVVAKRPLNIKQCNARFTTDIIGSCAFGIECNSFNDAKFHNILREIFLGTTSFLKLSFCNALPSVAQFLRIPLFPIKPTFEVTRSIEETVKYRTENNITRNDFLQIVMEMMDKDVVDMVELKSQCLLFFLAGFETSSTTLTFMLFELAIDQSAQKKLHEEIVQVLAKHKGEITYEAIMEMKYLEAVMFETLRKYPAVPFLNRKCVEEMRLPNSDIVIEKDTNILIPLMGLHYDPVYFPEPDKFDPERFSEENKAKIIPYTYMPFGEGPRNCIGDRFGKQQVKVGIVYLLQKYRFKLNPKVKLPLQWDTGLIPAAKEDILLDVSFWN